ncbi:hypothetical protein D3C80_2129530 [compost metagenome]
MLDEAAAELGNMYQPIVLDADIDEGAEIDYIADGSLHLHAGNQVLDLQHIGAEDRQR